ncbi:MAG: FHA domain-containing protein [Myxococcota bacterium]
MARPVLRILTPQIGAQEQVFALADAPVRIGRDETNDIVLLEQAASRHHARIEPTADGGYEVVDEGSAAGVTVGGAKVLRKVLADGDEIKIGGTTVRFVAAAGSEPTIVPAGTPPSSKPTEAAANRTPAAPPTTPLPPDPFGDADTMLPDPAKVAMPPTVATEQEAAPSASETVSAPHEPAAPPPSETVAAAHQPAAPPPSETVAAVHQPAPAPAPAPEPKLELDTPPAAPPTSNPSFVLDGGKSSPSNYTLEGSAAAGTSGGYSIDGNASAAPAKSGGYKLDGADDDPLGGVVIHGDTPPSSLRSGPGAGTYVTFGLIGAVIGFGALVALQGVPW